MVLFVLDFVLVVIVVGGLVVVVMLGGFVVVVVAVFEVVEFGARFLPADFVTVTVPGYF